MIDLSTLPLALTFDDDYDSHAREVLPILQQLRLHGTFFLSGRALNGLGGYWFQPDGVAAASQLRERARLRQYFGRAIAGPERSFHGVAVKGRKRVV